MPCALWPVRKVKNCCRWMSTWSPCSPAKTISIEVENKRQGHGGIFIAPPCRLPPPASLLNRCRDSTENSLFSFLCVCVCSLNCSMKGIFAFTFQFSSFFVSISLVLLPLSLLLLLFLLRFLVAFASVFSVKCGRALFTWTVCIPLPLIVRVAQPKPTNPADIWTNNALFGLFVLVCVSFSFSVCVCCFCAGLCVSMS